MRHQSEKGMESTGKTMIISAFQGDHEKKRIQCIAVHSEFINAPGQQNVKEKRRERQRHNEVGRLWNGNQSLKNKYNMDFIHFSTRSFSYLK